MKTIRTTLLTVLLTAVHLCSSSKTMYQGSWAFMCVMYIIVAPDLVDKFVFIKISYLEAGAVMITLVIAYSSCLLYTA